MMTSSTSSREGISYIRSSIIPSRRLRRARAPVPLVIALSARHFRASRVKFNFTPSIPKSLAYCLVRQFFVSVRTAMSSSAVSGLRWVRTGRRPMNSGIMPNFRRSSGSVWRRRVGPSSIIGAEPGPAPKPKARPPSRLRTISSRPTKPPPQMKRMFWVLMAICSCWGCLRPPWGGTWHTVPSRIFRSPCWTPSPETSRVMEALSDLRPILSISSI